MKNDNSATKCESDQEAAKKAWAEYLELGIGPDRRAEYAANEIYRALFLDGFRAGLEAVSRCF